MLLECISLWKKNVFHLGVKEFYHQSHRSTPWNSWSDTYVYLIFLRLGRNDVLHSKNYINWLIIVVVKENLDIFNTNYVCLHWFSWSMKFCFLWFAAYCIILSAPGCSKKSKDTNSLILYFAYLKRVVGSVISMQLLLGFGGVCLR